MYLRHTTVSKNSKSHTYWRLVRSVRIGNRVRQQTVAPLGDLDAAGRLRARALADAIIGVEHQPGLFEEPGPTEPVTVDRRAFRLQRGRRFGDVWLGLRLGQALGLDTLLQELLPPGREDVPWAQARQGCYVLRSNGADWDADELWRAYMHLTDAEAAFGAHKTDLRIRPVWPQTAGRVQAHLLVCFLAYVLRKTLQGWMARAGLGHSPATVLEELARIQSTDGVAPTTDGRTLRLGCVVHPDKAQSNLLSHLGRKLPQRLRRPAGVRQS